MLDLNKITGDWLHSLKHILLDYPAEYSHIEKLCEQKKYNVAFMFADEFIHEKAIKKTDAFEKVDYDFYFSIR